MEDEDVGEKTLFWGGRLEVVLEKAVWSHFDVAYELSLLGNNWRVWEQVRIYWRNLEEIDIVG